MLATSSESAKFINMKKKIFFLCRGASTRHVVNYVRLIMELDAHSVYHLLPEIQHPILLISGLFDPVTPAYHCKLLKTNRNTFCIHVFLQSLRWLNSFQTATTSSARTLRM